VAIGGTVYGVSGAFLASLAVSAAMWGASSFLGKRPSISDFAKGGLLINSSNATDVKKVIYGKCRVGGNRVFVHTTGTTNKDLHIIIIWATHRCKGVYVDGAGEQVWLGEKREQYYQTYKGLNLVFHEFHDGDANQVISPTLPGYFGAWADLHKRTCYSYFRLKYHATAWVSLPDFTCIMEGRNEIYDPRDGSIGYSRNPALIARDFFTHPLYGGGMAGNLVNKQSIKDAAAWCDNTAGGRTPFYFDGAISTYQEFLNNLEAICLNFHADFVPCGAEWKLIVSSYSGSVMELKEVDIREDPNRKNSLGITSAGIQNNWKFIKGVFADPVDNYIPKYCYWPQDPPAGDADVDATFEFIGTASFEQCLKLLKYYFLRKNFSNVFSFSAHPRTISLERKDMIQITHDPLQIVRDIPSTWNQYLVRVQSNETDQTDQIILTCLDEDVSIYEETVNVETHLAYSTTLPSGEDAEAIPTNLTASTGEDESTDRKVDSFVLFSWDNVRPGSGYQLRWRKSTVSKWKTENIKDPNDAAEWVALNNYVLGDFCYPTVANTTGYYYEVTIDAGSSGGSEPTWPTTPGNTVVDGGITWTCREANRIELRVGKLECNIIIYWQVKTLGEKNDSEWATPGSPVTTWSPAAPGVAGVVLTATGKKDLILLEWTDPTDPTDEKNIKRWRLYKNTINSFPGDANYFDRKSAATRSFRDTKAVPGTLTYYWLKIENKDGLISAAFSGPASATASSADTVDTVAPTVPTDLHIDVVDEIIESGLPSGRVFISADWGESTDAAGNFMGYEWKIEANNLPSLVWGNPDTTQAYHCIENHTSSAARRPSSGANYSRFWVAETGTPDPAQVTVWKSGKKYLAKMSDRGTTTKDVNEITTKLFPKNEGNKLSENYGKPLGFRGDVRAFDRYKNFSAWLSETQYKGGIAKIAETPDTSDSNIPKLIIEQPTSYQLLAYSNVVGAWGYYFWWIRTDSDFPAGYFTVPPPGTYNYRTTCSQITIPFQKERSVTVYIAVVWLGPDGGYYGPIKNSFFYTPTGPAPALIPTSPPPLPLATTGQIITQAGTKSFALEMMDSIQNWIADFASVKKAFLKTGAVYTDITTEVNNATANDFDLMPATPVFGDGILIGGRTKFRRCQVNVGTAGVGTWTIVPYFYSADGEELWPLESSLSGDCQWKTGGLQTFEAQYQPIDWIESDVEGETAYWLFFKITAFTDMDTQPKGTQGLVECIGIDLEINDIRSGNAAIRLTIPAHADVLNKTISCIDMGKFNEFPCTNILHVGDYLYFCTWPAIHIPELRVHRVKTDGTDHKYFVLGRVNGTPRSLIYSSLTNCIYIVMHQVPGGDEGIALPQITMISLENFSTYATMTLPGPLWQDDPTAGMLSQLGLGSFDAANLIDDDTGTIGFDTETAVEGAYLEIDFGTGGDIWGDLPNIGKIRLYLSDANASIWEIQYSDDGINWSIAAKDFGPFASSGWFEKTWDRVGHHQFCRLYLTNDPGTGGTYQEIETYAYQDEDENSINNAFSQMCIKGYFLFVPMAYGPAATKLQIHAIDIRNYSYAGIAYDDSDYVYDGALSCLVADSTNVYCSTYRMADGYPGILKFTVGADGYTLTLSAFKALDTSGIIGPLAIDATYIYALKSTKAYRLLLADFSTLVSKAVEATYAFETLWFDINATHLYASEFKSANDPKVWKLLISDFDTVATLAMTGWGMIQGHALDATYLYTVRRYDGMFSIKRITLASFTILDTIDAVRPNVSVNNFLRCFLKSDRLGTNFQTCFGEAAVTEQTHDVVISQLTLNQWKEELWDIRAIAAADRDALMYYGLKITNVDEPMIIIMDPIEAIDQVTSQVKQLDGTYANVITTTFEGTGLDADKSPTPRVGEYYYASDTGIQYKCFVAGTWTEVGRKMLTDDIFVRSIGFIEEFEDNTLSVNWTGAGVGGSEIWTFNDSGVLCLKMTAGAYVYRNLIKSTYPKAFSPLRKTEGKIITKVVLEGEIRLSSVSDIEVDIALYSAALIASQPTADCVELLFDSALSNKWRLRTYEGAEEETETDVVADTNYIHYKIEWSATSVKLYLTDMVTPKATHTTRVPDGATFLFPSLFVKDTVGVDKNLFSAWMYCMHEE
jgi:hypothetical protein